MRHQRDGWAVRARALIALGLVAACNDVTQPPSTALIRSDAVNPQESGTFHLLWGDGLTAADSRQRYLLVDDQGRTTELKLDDALLNRHGGPLKLANKRIRVDGEDVPRGRGTRTLRVRSLTVEAESAFSPLVSGARPYATILCKFAESSVEPRTRATYKSWMGDVYPGLDHTWREISYNLVNLAGSVVKGWYVLPHPRSHYVSENDADLAALAEDCTSAADADVFFPAFAGVNLQFNLGLDCCSWGGGVHLTIDGVSKSYGATWLADWAGQGIYSHEIGHSFGLPHSSGPYGHTYDSAWDVMSMAGLYVPALSGSFGQHTIAYHKDLLGWIPAGRRLAAHPGTIHTFVVERTALPPAGNYLMATIPIAATPDQFYTVEARALVGYDTPLPGAAIILHHVDPARGHDRPARVVDVDNNGNVNDAGAMWLPGETFTDAANGISMTVVSATATGFQVSISNHAAAPTGFSVTPSASAVKLKWRDTPYETSYEVRRATAPEGGPEGAFSTVGSVAANILKFVDATAAPATRYRYLVRACNAYGCTADASAFSIPAAPTGFAANVESGRLVLRWRDTPNETEYRIQRALAPEDAAAGANLLLATLGSNSTSLADSSADPNTRYRYRIRACNVGGCSDYSYVFAITPPPFPTSAPPSVTGFQAGLGSGAVLLSWLDGPDEFDYVAERALAPEGGAVGSFSMVGTVTAGVTSLPDAQAAASTRYRYRVRACNSFGCSGSVHVYVTTPGSPAAPALTAVPANTRMVLSWTLTPFESTYRLQRALAPEGGSIGAYELVAELGANATTFADSAADPGRRYRYRIRACDGWGCSGYDYVTLYTLPSVFTRAALGITQNSVSMQGWAVTNDVSYGAGYEWGTHPALSTYNTTPLFEGLTATTNFARGVFNLSCNTTYYYRAMAKVTSGLIARGDIVSFTTAPC